MTTARIKARTNVVMAELSFSEPPCTKGAINSSCRGILVAKSYSDFRTAVKTRTMECRRMEQGRRRKAPAEKQTPMDTPFPPQGNPEHKIKQ
jgi:hypothetical protein